MAEPARRDLRQTTLLYAVPFSIKFDTRKRLLLLPKIIPNLNFFLTFSRNLALAHLRWLKLLRDADTSKKTSRAEIIKKLASQ
jgi:hypothetical protein